jgi:hypothetical protein
MTKECNQLEKPATKNLERRLGQRFIKIRYNEDHTVEFRVFVTQPDGKRSVRVFGGGVFEQQDLYEIAITLNEFARDAMPGQAWQYETEEAWEGKDG